MTCRATDIRFLASCSLVLASLLCVFTQPTEAQVSPIPLQDLDPDPSISLSQDPGVFGWTFGAAGWPNGLSSVGQSPNHVQLYWDDVPVEDLLTARPGFDLVPVALLDSRSWGAYGSAALRTDSLNSGAPLTRVRYESAGDGRQGVRALHVQNRVIPTSDSTAARLQTVFGYAGAGGRGEYDGSRLRRAREITLQIRWQAPTWSAWVTEVASRRRVGAQSGVIPFTGATYESIYQRLRARVGDENARRRTIRNDLRLGGDRHWAAGTSSIVLSRSSQTLDFEGESLEVRGWTTRWRMDARHEMMFGPGAVTFHGFSLRDAGFGGSAWTDAPDARSFAGVTGTLTTGRWQISGGLRRDDSDTWLVVHAKGDVQFGPLHTWGAAALDARRSSLMEMTGFGGAASAAASTLTPTRMLRAGVAVPGGPFRFSLEGTIWQEQDALEHRLTDTHPALESSEMAGTRSRTQVTATLDWRNDGRRGLYGRVSGTVQSASSDATDAWAVAWQNAMPGEWASARLGWRALLFQKDLDLDLYARARYWGAMHGLRLHTPTGLLVLPEAGAAAASEGWLVDIVAEGGVRGATLFVSYENMFSGTTAQIGNLIIPDYPLPRQRLRFGVYWPIQN